MNIEIVEFYEFRRDEKKFKIEGTLHVYLIDLDIDIRGIYAVRSGDRLFIEMAYKTGIDEDTKEHIRYPVFSFTDREKNKILLEKIREKAEIYVNLNTQFKRMSRPPKKKAPELKKEFKSATDEKFNDKKLTGHTKPSSFTDFKTRAK